MPCCSTHLHATTSWCWRRVCTEVWQDGVRNDMGPFVRIKYCTVCPLKSYGVLHTCECTKLIEHCSALESMSPHFKEWSRIAGPNSNTTKLCSSIGRLRAIPYTNPSCYSKSKMHRPKWRNCSTPENTQFQGMKRRSPALTVRPV